MDIELLSALYTDDGEGTFRFLIDKCVVKYIDIDEGVYSSEMMGFGPVLIPQLPPFPPGSWNRARISKDPASGKGMFSRLEESSLPRVNNIWHPSHFDILTLETEMIRPGLRRLLSSHRPTLLKYDQCFQFIDCLDRETSVYEWLQGTGIGPQFYGHAFEHGRAIGFLVEEIVGARHAGPGDLEICRKALAEMHNLGFLHGDINKFNFLIKDGAAMMIDFSETRRDVAPEELEEEMSRLEGELNDPGFRGGSIRLGPLE